MSNSPKARLRNDWQRRIARAEELGRTYSFAAEILRFYVTIARFQENFHAQIESAHAQPAIKAGATPSDAQPFAEPLPADVIRHFAPFLSLVEQNGPTALQETARELRGRGKDSQFELLSLFWSESESSALSPGPQDFFARAFLQPYAVSLRSAMQWSGPTPFRCPFCHRKPGLGVLRPLGEGGQRSLVCSFCLAEWEFRRIVCPGCGEENHAKLPVYTSDELQHVRVEACDTCRTYIKTVDMTKSGRSEPIVDEIAAIPLDLWATNQGYTKLQVNLMQL